MANVALIGCSAKKLGHAARVRNLYTGHRFTLACGWASRNHVDCLFALSGRHGLLGMEDVREPYDEPLVGKSPDELHTWARYVCTALPLRVPSEIDEIVVLAEDLYADPLRTFLINVNVSYPLAGMDETRQKAFLAS